MNVVVVAVGQIAVSCSLNSHHARIMMLNPSAVKAMPGKRNDGSLVQSSGKEICISVASANSANAIRGGLQASIFERVFRYVIQVLQIRIAPEAT